MVQFFWPHSVLLDNTCTNIWPTCNMSTFLLMVIKCSVIYKVAQKMATFCTPYLCQILSDFQNYFTIIIRRNL